MRNLIAGALISLVWTAAAFAQASPPDAMWPETSHDFGTVPRGAQLLYRIPWKNPEAHKVEIADLRVSCGCATVTPQPRVLEPGQSGFLEVAMDGRRFTGVKIVFIQLVTNPGPKAMTLQIVANSRQDLVYNPGQFKFGVLPPGTAATQTVEVEYAGALDWKITGIERCPDHLEGKVEESYRKPGQVGYKITATLKESVPPGDYKQQLVLKTNDPTEPTIAVVVEAAVRAPVAVTPNPVSFGTTKTGKMVSRRFTIRTDRPFQILRIEGAVGVSAAFTPSAANVQSVLLQWTPTEAGEMAQELTVVTDLPTAAELKVSLTGTAK